MPAVTALHATVLDITALAVAQMRAARRLDAARTAVRAVERAGGRVEWGDRLARELRAAHQASRSACAAYDAACRSERKRIKAPRPEYRQLGLL